MACGPQRRGFPLSFYLSAEALVRPLKQPGCRNIPQLYLADTTFLLVSFPIRLKLARLPFTTQLNLVGS